MRYVVAFLPALACVGLMYGCVRMMMRGSHDSDSRETSELEGRVRELESEVERLREERGDVARRLEV
jgi:hypothetical protein